MFTNESKISSSYNVFHLGGWQQNMNELGCATNGDLQWKENNRKRNGKDNK